MRAILAFELRLLRGGLSALLFALLVTGALILAFLVGRVMPFATEAVLWIAPLALLALLWRERTAQHQLVAMTGSVPASPVDLLASHLLFWALVALVPSAALALIAHGPPGAGPGGALVFGLGAWVWFLVGISGVSWLTYDMDRRPEDARHGLIVVVVVLVLAMLPSWAERDLMPTIILLIVVVAIQVRMYQKCRSTAEFLPSLTPKRVRVRATSEPERGKAVPWRHRRDREGVRQARNRNARSPSSTLAYLLAPFWVVPVFGVYLSGFIGMQASRAGTTWAAGLVVLLVILHIHVHLALPRWWFLRRTPLPKRRILVWLLAPLLLMLLPSAFVARGSLEATLDEADFAPHILVSTYFQLEDRRGLAVPRALEKPLEHAEGLPWQLPSPVHGTQLFRERGQALIPDEGKYFDQTVSFFLRTRFHVEPAPGELRPLLGPPQAPEQIAALAMWGGKRDADGELFVQGEFPLDLRDELVSRRFESMQRARGDHLHFGEMPPDPSLRLVYEAEIAQVLAAHKRDGAVYVFSYGLGRVWDAFEGRIREARTQRIVLDLGAFFVLLLISLRWGIRDAASRWLAPLIAAAVVFAWSQLAWWPIGTTAYLWGIRHFGLVLAVAIVLAVVAAARLARALRTMEAPAVESL